MRDFRDAKTMARALRDALKAKGVAITHSESLELIATTFGYENWNILSAKIEAAATPAGDRRSPSSAGVQNGSTSPRTLYCSFCGKSQHEVKKLVAGPEVFICDECIDLCTNVVEPDDDTELFRLMKGNDEVGSGTDPALLELARGTSTEELAHYVERGRKGVERNRVALQSIQRWVATQDGEADKGDNIPERPRHLMDKTRDDLVTLQQNVQRELRRYQDALAIATTVLSERRQ